MEIPAQLSAMMRRGIANSFVEMFSRKFVDRRARLASGSVMSGEEESEAMFEDESGRTREEPDGKVNSDLSDELLEAPWFLVRRWSRRSGTEADLDLPKS